MTVIVDNVTALPSGDTNHSRAPRLPRDPIPRNHAKEQEVTVKPLTMADLVMQLSTTDPVNGQELLAQQGLSGVIFSDTETDALVDQMFDEVESQTQAEEEPVAKRPEGMGYEELLAYFLAMMNPTPISKNEPMAYDKEAGNVTLAEYLRVVKIAKEAKVVRRAYRNALAIDFNQRLKMIPVGLRFAAMVPLLEESDPSL